MIKIHVCIPGRSFSSEFLDCLFTMMNWGAQNNIQFTMWKRYNANLYLSRNMCLGSVPQAGIHQKPWQGEFDYDYMLWIDSDMIWYPEAVQKLINANVDYVSGLYKIENGIEFATCINKDMEYFAKTGRFEMLTEETLATTKLNEETGLLEVEYTGLGFTLIRKGVWELFEYPWFIPTMEEHIYSEEGKEDILVRDFTSDDGGMIQRFSTKGIKCWVDPNVRLGHQKSVVIPGEHPDVLRAQQEEMQKAMNIQSGLTTDGKTVGSSKDVPPTVPEKIETPEV